MRGGRDLKRKKLELTGNIDINLDVMDNITDRVISCRKASSTRWKK